jgi:pimeloyl-ACP methyl ester carboxylesterase
VQEYLLDTGETQINVAEGPDNGSPMILVHGFQDRWQSFQSIIPDLEYNCHLYAYDQRGQGKSGKKPGAYRYRDYYHDLEKIVEDKVKEPTLLFGHSLGGAISIMYAANHPEHTRALIIGDSPMNFPGSPMQRQLKNVGIWSVYEDYYKGYDVSELLPKITCPTLLLRTNPNRGGLIPEPDLKKVKELKPDMKYVYYEKIGHDLHKENPKEILQSINEFLSQL